jgi:outer membrane protein TolC
VLVSGNLYLRTLAEQSRVEAARAEAETARALHKLAVDRKAAGVVPGVDVLRAEVELRSREQRVIAAETRWARAKLDLSRAIGLPLGQEIQLTDTMPPPVFPALTIEQRLEMAFTQRSDWKAAQARVRAAEAARQSCARRGPARRDPGRRLWRHRADLQRSAQHVHARRARCGSRSSRAAWWRARSWPRTPP